MKNFALHHSAVARGSVQLYAVNRYHRDLWWTRSHFNWFVGYNYFIDSDGTLTYTREIGEETMAQKGHNWDTISVCLAGNFDIESPSGAQKQVLRGLYNKVREDYPNIIVTTHAALQEGRTCPGKNFTQRQINEVLADKSDEEDKTKEHEIKKLQAQIDALRAILAKLRSLLSIK